MPRPFKKLELFRFGDDFRACTRIVDDVLPDPGPAQAVVRVVYAGVNGVMDFNMARNSVAYRRFTVPCDTGAESIGVVEAVGSGVSDLKPGDAVVHGELGQGYREAFLTEAAKLVRVRAPTPDLLTLFSTGVSGLVGLEQVGGLARNETVVVTAAAGGLGHIVAQIALRAGNRVIAVVGGPRKVAAVAGLGVREIIDYRAEPLGAALDRVVPQGIDLAFDSVGGATFDALVDHLAVRGRVVVSGYTADKLGDPEIVSRPRIYHALYGRAASIRAFQAAHFRDFWPEAASRLFAWYDEGAIKVLVDPTRFEGLGAVADAGDYLRRGANVGKVVVRISGD